VGCSCCDGGIGDVPPNTPAKAAGFKLFISSCNFALGSATTGAAGPGGGVGVGAEEGGGRCSCFLSPMNTPRKIEVVRVDGTEKSSRRSVNSGNLSVGLNGIR
jgi:hypothetical protein